MLPMNMLAIIVLQMMTILAGDEADGKTMNLMARSSDGAALCALDLPTLSTGMSPSLPEAPDAVRCGMTCHEDAECKQFNYISTELSPCQLYNYRPTSFDVSPNCQHFYQPGQQSISYVNVNCHISL